MKALSIIKLSSLNLTVFKTYVLAPTQNLNFRLTKIGFQIQDAQSINLNLHSTYPQHLLLLDRLLKPQPLTQ